MTDRDLLTLLRNIDNDVLLYACQGRDEDFLYRITSQFSSTAKKYFYEDLARLPSLDVDRAQAACRGIEKIFHELVLAGHIQDWPTKYAS